ncbi:helix-turn-helix transcriptional regulator [Paenibacillus sp. N3.4]|uniref:helix-turn-helix transcriptional regulator n=1 Tax=Paenibacillus sp. N3.4 TaxID=2603222 RepID=UPI0011C9DF76|nr:helix-turn-helix transcriptional regulator [Paenibacillus sp. N3.4]TXK83689.1 AraC family transcriptional regulator [Paenibacillus sp. N3.4]
MENKFNHMAIRIHWINEKMTYPGWSDIRQNTKLHSFYWIRAGKGTFRTTEEISVETGMLFYLKPGLNMEMASDPEDPLCITMVLLSLCKLSMDEQEAYETSKLTELNLPFMLHVKDQMAAAYDRIFMEISEGWVPGQAESELLTQSLLYKLLYLTHMQKGAGSTKTTAMDIYMKVKDELEKNYREEIRLTELARKYQISASYLRHVFQHHLGQSPKSYLQTVRNEHAKKQLLYTELNMKDIAENCGFADEFHFSKSFKKMNGMAPKQFRNKTEYPNPRS